MENEMLLEDMSKKLDKVEARERLAAEILAKEKAEQAGRKDEFGYG